MLTYSSLIVSISDLPAIHELQGAEFSLHGRVFRVESVSGLFLDPEALPSGGQVRIRFATPVVLRDWTGLPPLSAILESVAEIWERHLGVRLKVPAKVKVLRAKLRVLRGPWGSGLVGWAVLKQEGGESLGAVAQTASLSGAGIWRLLGFGAVEAEVL